MERFLLSQVLATASKLKSVDDKDPHILKRDAKKSHRICQRQARGSGESSLKGIHKRSKLCFFLHSLCERGFFTQSKQRAETREPQAWEKVLERRGDRLVSHFVDRWKLVEWQKHFSL